MALADAFARFIARLGLVQALGTFALHSVDLRRLQVPPKWYTDPAGTDSCAATNSPASLAQ